VFKTGTEFRISHLILALQSGTILSKLVSNTYNFTINSYESLISIALIATFIGDYSKKGGVILSEVMIANHTVTFNI
jgi:hypothetical protein